MADTKITALAAIGANPINVATFPIPMVDLLDNSMAASGTTKKVTVNQILGAGGTATLASATITGDLTVDTSTLKVDSANNRVGIGTATPTVPLDVVGIGGAIFNRGSANQYRLQIGNSNKRYGLYVDLNANNTDYFAIYDDTAVQQMLTYVPGASGSWTHYINGSTAMTLNSTGLGVGVSPAQKLDIGSAGTTRIAVRDTSSTGVGLLKASGADVYLDNASATGSLILQNANGTTRMTIDSTGQAGIGVTPSASGGCLQLKSGITFPATQVASSDANTLDDYEEGTWSPVISAGSGTPTTVTINSAVYTKVGRLVVCTFDFSIVNKGTASSSLQFGLPVTSITSTTFCGSFREDGITGNMGMVIYSTGTTSACLLYNNATPWVDGYRLKGTYTYFAA